MANYYHILKCMQEEEEVGLEASETVLKERARRGLEEEANKTEERVSGKDLGASETVLQERARGGRKKVAKKTESRARRKGKKHTEDVLHSEKGPRGKANVSPVLRVGTWNVNGIGNKWDPLVQVVDRSDIDILGVTEHHMRETDKHKMGPNSKFVWFGKVSKEIAAGSKKGSQGVGFLVLSRVVDMVSIVDCGESPHATRHMWLKVRCNGNINIYFGVVYMPVAGVSDAFSRDLLEEVSGMVRKLSEHGEVIL